MERSEWFTFSIKDLLVVTAVVAITSGFIEVMERVWPTGDRWFHIVAYFPVFGSAVGWLAKRFRGALIGTALGGGVAIAGWFFVAVYPRL